MLINIRGTHGSGKSTIVKTILDKYPNEVVSYEEGRKTPKPHGYRVKVPFLKQPIMVVGSYVTSCGGCDGIQPYTLIWPRVVEYQKQGHVLFEGALVSSSYGKIGEASEIYGDSFVFAFMDTPVEKCIQWVTERRKKKGNDKPLDPRNVIEKMKNVQRSITKIRDHYKRTVVMVDHRRGVSQVLGMFYASENG